MARIGRIGFLVLMTLAISASWAPLVAACDGNGVVVDGPDNAVVGRLYVVVEACGFACPKVFVYQEANGIEGLQRGDWHSSFCANPDVLVAFYYPYHPPHSDPGSGPWGAISYLLGYVDQDEVIPD